METNYKKLYLDILAENTSIPNALLDHYRDLGLTSDETLFLITLLRLKNKKAVLSFKNIYRESIYT